MIQHQQIKSKVFFSFNNSDTIIDVSESSDANTDGTLFETVVNETPVPEAPVSHKSTSL